MLPPSAIAALRSRVEHGLLLRLGHRPLVEIGALVRLEARAVLRLHQAHAELIEPVAPARLFGVEDRRARDVEIRLVERHHISSTFLPASRGASGS